MPTFHIDAARRIGIGRPANELANVIQHKPLATTPADAMLERGLETTEEITPIIMYIMVGGPPLNTFKKYTLFQCISRCGGRCHF